MQIKTVYSEFLFDCEMKKFSKKTLKGYRNNLLRLFNYLDEKYNIQDIEEVTSKQIKELFKDKYYEIIESKSFYENWLTKMV